MNTEWKSLRSEILSNLKKKDSQKAKIIFSSETFYELGNLHDKNLLPTEEDFATTCAL